jgi:GWxTD domain-containing protein
MNRKVTVWFLFAAICLAWAGTPGHAGAQAADQLTVYAGATQYPNPERDSLVVIEFPFSVKRHEFEFFPVDSPASGLQARIFAQATLIGSDGMPVDSAFTYFALRAEDREDAGAEGVRIFNRIALAVQPGVYSARLTVIDVSSKRQGRYFIDQVSVAPPARERFSLSDIQYAYKVRRLGAEANGNPRLVKNGYEIVPNPLSIFGTEDSVVYLYAEAYNLTGAHSQSDSFRQRIEVLDEDTVLVADLGGRVAEKPGPAMVIAESFSIRGWSSGLYYIRLSLYDGMSDSGAVRLEPFRIISPEELRAQLARADRFDPYDTLSVQDKLNLVHYLLTPHQKSTMSNLTEQGRLNYLEQFWKDLDPDPTTAVNEYRAEIISRYDYANRMFSTNAEKDNGWRTDRGRIYMTHGPYDQINDRHAPQLAAPYQIWHYYEVGEGTYYVFEDQFRDNEYELVHSNDPKEVWSREWESRIETGEIDLIH